jgi:hypothetical protein
MLRGQCNNCNKTSSLSHDGYCYECLKPRYKPNNSYHRKSNYVIDKRMFVLIGDYYKPRCPNCRLLLETTLENKCVVCNSDPNKDNYGKPLQPMPPPSVIY